MGSILLPRHYRAQEHGTAATLRVPGWSCWGLQPRRSFSRPEHWLRYRKLSRPCCRADWIRPPRSRHLSSRDPADVPQPNLSPIRRVYRRSIGAASDIRPFLEPGVPEDLARVALRRAWAAD